MAISVERLLRWLAAPAWMLAFFAFAAGSALLSIYRPQWITPVWGGPLTIFALSLLAAVATNTRFRRDVPLLSLHLALLMLVVLVVAARATYLDGAVTLTQGEEFTGRLQLDRRGPWHPDRLTQIRFANEGFVEEFAAADRWRAIRHRVRWQDVNGQRGEAEIGDDRPLLIDGYRIYTTFNRGYAPVFSWQPATGAESVGAVQLRPGENFSMANEWQLPGGPMLWIMLEGADPRKLGRGTQRANLDAAALRHRLIVRNGDQRVVLTPGDSVTYPQGRLTYRSLSTWMGYRVVYDPVGHWLAAAAVAVVISLVWFYARLLFVARRRSATAAEGPCVIRV